MISSLFGKAKQAPPPSERIKEMRDAVEQLEKREKYLEKKAEAELQGIKKLQGKNRKAALGMLKRKKQIEAQIEKLGMARSNIDNVIMAIEAASTNMLALNTMKMGTQTLQQMTRSMNVDQVDDIMEDMQEQMDLANEIGDAISRPVGDTFDEDDLMSELDEIERQELDSKLTDELPELNALPSPSTQVPVAAAAKPAARSTEEDQFNELEGMMN